MLFKFRLVKLYAMHVYMCECSRSVRAGFWRTPVPGCSTIGGNLETTNYRWRAECVPSDRRKQTKPHVRAATRWWKVIINGYNVQWRWIGPRTRIRTWRSVGGALYAGKRKMSVGHYYPAAMLLLLCCLMPIGYR